MVLILPILWIIGLFLLYILYRYDKKILNGNLNKFLFIICTPIPTVLFLLGYYIWETKFESQKTENIYNKNGYIVKVTNYPYRDRTEYRSNFDSKTGELLIDSVKYYNKEEKKYITETYEDWERFLLSERK
ncbi:MAG: hypothetical protein C4K58_07005 [Flavobacteriaceae bacterium]|nr:MAG: hypothetical protein C4K58_07005 [Flavobacteriaceae bacterium]